MTVAVEFPSSLARIQAIRSAVHEAGYSICLERPELLWQYRRSKQGKQRRHDHVLVRRASEIAWIMAQRQPRIYADELIIGNMTSKRVAAHYYPEGTSFHILEDLHRLDDRVVPLQLTTREKARLAFLAAALSRESLVYHALIKPGRIGRVKELLQAERYIVTEMAGVGHQVGQYARIVREGLVASDQCAAHCLAHNRTPEGLPLDADQRAFYESQRLIIAGIRTMAANLASEAEHLALLPGTTATRRQELLDAARSLRQVPYYPARHFREGLQACWLMHVAQCLEDFEQGMSFGRLDQALIHLYEQDRAQGTLTEEQAVELVASFQLKCGETMPAYSTRMDQYFSGHDVAQGITLGGVDAQGNDVTNALSGIFLDAYARIGTREPSLHVRIHAHTPDWFLQRCIHTLQQTGARPAFYGDNAVIKAMEQAGYSPEHARDYAVIGCTELGSQGRTHNSADAALANLPLCLEQALNGGRTFNGHFQGAATPGTDQLQDMNAVIAAYRKQVQHMVDDMATVMGWLEAAIRAHRTTPVNSLMTDGTLQSGRDVTWGGAQYSFSSVQAVGLATVGDSLHAIDHLVFQTRRFTLPQLVEILRQDFQGHETLAIEMQRKLPRYGNGNPAADQWVQLAADAFVDAVSPHHNSRGGRWLAGFYSMTCGHAFGRFTGASADGRRAGTRLSNGASPSDGADKAGPSALFRSVASLDKSRWCNSHVLNATFDRKTIGGKAGAAKLASLLRTYFVDQDGLQVQIALLNADDLIKARENPDQFPNLLVRVSGYCAYFADLNPEVQDEIIARTLHH
jgi:formate C-acetyltransferase